MAHEDKSSTESEITQTDELVRATVMHLLCDYATSESQPTEPCGWPHCGCNPNNQAIVLMNNIVAAITPIIERRTAERCAEIAERRFVQGVYNVAGHVVAAAIRSTFPSTRKEG